ncbi:MAG: tetratricopeptide repeat protein [Planctomycetota bacterium]|nr:tetratricopeptide repeat protein [Planctomycetota bacterium]
MQEQHYAGKQAPSPAARANGGKTLRARLCAAMLLGLSVSGCASQSSNRFGGLAMPKFGKSDTGASMGSSLAGTGKTVKNQLSSVGSAVSSAYSKTKTAIAAPFTPASTSSMETSESESKSTANPLSIAPEILVAQGNYFESQGNYTKALDSYSRALETEPKNAVALLSMARLYDRQQDAAKSIEFYQKTIAAAPANADACMELGKLHARTGDLASAKQHLSKAVELQPSNKSYRQALAGAMLDAGDATGSMSELTQCESPAMAQYQMAYLHFQRKNIPATQQHLSEALKIDPNLKPARDLLTSIGGAANIDQLVDRGRQVSQQASGIYQQAGVLANGISSAWNGVPEAASQASVQGIPSVTAPAANLLGIPVAPLPSHPAIPSTLPSEEAVRVRLGE